jgi:hypothetical protein
MLSLAQFCHIQFNPNSPCVQDYPLDLSMSPRSPLPTAPLKIRQDLRATGTTQKPPQLKVPSPLGNNVKFMGKVCKVLNVFSLRLCAVK